MNKILTIAIICIAFANALAQKEMMPVDINSDTHKKYTEAMGAMRKGTATKEQEETAKKHIEERIKKEGKIEVNIREDDGKLIEKKEIKSFEELKQVFKKAREGHYWKAKQK